MHARLFDSLLLIIHHVHDPSFTLLWSSPALTLHQTRRHPLWSCQPVDVTQADS